MKKILALFLMLTLLVNLVPGLAESAEPLPVPAVGDVTEGFEVKEIREFPMLGAQVVFYEHQKTGAKVLWVANDDTNRVF